LRRCIVPGTIKTATDYRNERAFKMMLKGINPIPTGETGEYRVSSQGASDRKYTVSVDIDGEVLVDAHCTCPDWRRMHEAVEECFARALPGIAAQFHPGVDQINGVAVCKHVRLTLMSYGFLAMPAYTLDFHTEVAAPLVSV
jgi:hypothetical protein